MGSVYYCVQIDILFARIFIVVQDHVNNFI